MSYIQYVSQKMSQFGSEHFKQLLIGNTVRTRGFVYHNLAKGCGDNAGIDKKLMGYVELDGTGITCKWGEMECDINRELIK
jgi:hypothetical protein